MGEMSTQKTTNHDAPVLIDYYKMLALPPEAPDAEIRQRISELYVKAQQNLDHRNHRKRFYYHELYEVHIPQARIFLLDPQKRVAYDKFLAGHRGQQWQPAPRTPAEDQKPARDVSHLPATQNPVPEVLPAAARVNASPVPVPTFAAATATASGAGAVRAFSGAGVLSGPAPVAHPRIAPPQVVSQRGATPSTSAPQNDAAEERRRDNQRRELIKHELIFVGMRWGVLSGLAVVAVCSLLLLVFSFVLPRGAASLGLSNTGFPVGHALGMVLLATLGARSAMRWARRRVVGLLSQMPYEELLRHCAH